FRSGGSPSHHGWDSGGAGCKRLLAWRRSRKLGGALGRIIAMSTEVPASELIQRWRKGENQALAQLFERYRHYLRILAQTQMCRHLRAKGDPSDRVQQPLLEASRDFAGFRGAGEGDLLAWLRRILAHNLFNEARHFAAQQRDAAREVSLEQLQAGLDHSSLTLGSGLAADVTPPSQIACQHEATVRLDDALTQLPV